MRERLYIYDNDGRLVNDPRGSHEYASGLQWETMWPKGFGAGGVNVERDLTEQWAVKSGYRFVVRDGLYTCYDGRCGAPKKDLNGQGQKIQLPATGWYAVFAERKLHKRWADSAAIDRLEWNKEDLEQQTFPSEKHGRVLLVRMADKDLGRDGTERYSEKYLMPAGETIKRVTFSYETVGGETKLLAVMNGSGTQEWGSDLFTNTSLSAVDQEFATPTNKMTVRIGPTEADIYDQNDKVTIKELTVYSELGTIDAKNIIQDVIELLTDEISGDYTRISSTGYTLVPFITQNDGPETGDSIIQRAASYGDSSYRTWGAAVWDGGRSSDGLPQMYFSYRSTSDYEFETNLSELAEFEETQSEDELFNYIFVRYTDEHNKTRYVTPTDDGDLMDAVSMSRYGRRDYLLDAGNSTTAKATQLGVRYLSYHKDPLRQASFSQQGQIRLKSGVYVPTNRVRGGHRVKITDWDGGQVYFLRHTSYNADNELARMEPDLPPEAMDVYLNQQERIREAR